MTKGIMGSVVNNKKRILVICPTIWDVSELNQTHYQDDYELDFEGGYSRDDLESYDACDFIETVLRKYNKGTFAGVVGTHDYPGCIMAAILARAWDLPGPDPKALIRTQHKYLSRISQEKSAPQVTPKFALIRGTDDAHAFDALDFPIFVKPVKSVCSILAEKIGNADELADYLKHAKSINASFVAPFNKLLERYTSIEADGACFIAEELLCGVQVTVECFSSGGRAQVLGIVDSVMYAGTNSFERFEYPSRLPADVRVRMEEAAVAVMRGSGLDQCLTNIEMFYDKVSGQIHVIEVNPRMSYQFADLFNKVDGFSTYDLALRLATGESIRLSQNAGNYGVAVSFVLRTFEDFHVLDVPSVEQINHVQTTYPQTRVVPMVKPAERLSDHLNDPESFVYGIVNMGGNSWSDVRRCFEGARSKLPFAFAPVVTA